MTVALATAGTAAAVKLTPAPGSPSPGASGNATTKYNGPYGDEQWSYMVARTSFSVRGLKPATWYVLEAGNGNGGSNLLVKADKQSRASGAFEWTTYVDPGLWPVSYYLYEASDPTQTLVLIGGE